MRRPPTTPVLLSPAAVGVSRPWRRALALLALGLLLASAALFPNPAGAAPDKPLRYLGGEPGSLDPAHIADAGDVQLILQLYAGLTRFDEEGRVYASLAESWSTSTDGTTYTFHLRDDLRFSDGSPLTASDVRRSWLRILDPAVRSTAPDVLNVVVGAAERLAGGSESAVGVAAPDDRTLVVHLRHPATYFPAITATPATFVVPPTADATATWQQLGDFVGSGPYVADRQDGAELVLLANDEYVAGPPPISEVDWVTDVDTAIPSAFAAGDLDLARVGGSDATWIAFDPELGRSLHKAAAMTVSYFGFDTTRPPFDDARVRRAFALALDRTRLVELSRGAAGRVATSLVPPALWPNGPPTDEAASPAEARRLLHDAGYATGADLGPVTVNGTALGTGPAVATWERELGVTLHVEYNDFSEMLAVLPVRPPHIFTIGWIADYPSPYALYGLLLLPSAASNYGRWSDDQFVRLMEEASSAGLPAAQGDAWLAVESRVDQEAPVIPWSWDVDDWLARSDLRGLGQLTVGLLDFGRLSWDQ